MCGIVAIVAEDAGDYVRAMTATLRHRGPDAGNIVTGPGWAFGHRRLSIIDLSGGAQPMASEDGRLLVTYNGEIYNYLELARVLADRGHHFHTRSDTEVLLHAYREWGEGMVERLNGMFAFAIRDAERGTIFAARDRVGIKPLYWSTLGGRGLALASEPKALLAHPAVSRDLDLVALDAYLDLYYVPPPHSMFSGVHQLPPGHALHWDGRTATTRAWWDALPTIDTSKSAEEWAEIMAPVLEDAIVSQTVSDVPLGAFLSGGIDSSTIVAVLSERGFGPVETFCVGYGEEGRGWDERPIARQVAAHFGTRHHELELDIDVLGGLEDMVRGFDEPFGSPTALLSSVLSRFVRGFVTVALAGDGGDELFAGYPRYRGMMFAELAERMPRPMLQVGQRLVAGDEPSQARAYRRWARQFFGATDLPRGQRYASWVNHLRPVERDRLLRPEVLAEVRRRGRVDPVVTHFDHPRSGTSLERSAYADLHGFLPENVLRGSDRMSMAHGLELRVPFCDHRLVELAMQVPGHLRLGALTSKRILRRIMRDRLPPKVLRRRKLGFNAPIGVWMRRDLDRLVGEWLGPRTLAKRGLFDPTEVARLVDEHRSGRRDRSLPLWSLVVLEQWHRLYVDAA